MISVMARRREHEAEPTLYDVIDAMQAGFARMENKLEEHDVRFNQIDAELRQVNRRLFNLEIGVEDIRDIVQNHEERITKLERKK